MAGLNTVGEPVTNDVNPRRKLPEFLREDKPLGLRPSVWQRLTGVDGRPVARRTPPLPELPDHREWPQWAKIRLNLADLRVERIAELTRSLADQKPWLDDDADWLDDEDDQVTREIDFDYQAPGELWENTVPDPHYRWLLTAVLFAIMLCALFAAAFWLMDPR